jgi:6-pyruvoyl-tetrahydropterin synthase
MVSHVIRYVLVENIVKIIFEELDSEWLQSIWDNDDDTCSKMIEILYLIYIMRRIELTRG